LSASKFVAKLLRFKRYLKVVSVEMTNYGKRLDVFVKPYKNGGRCTECGRRGKIVKSLAPRAWRDTPIHDIEVWLHYRPREIRCDTHGRMQEAIPWADSYSRYTYRFEYAVARYAQSMSQKIAARLLGIAKSSFSDLLHRIINRSRSNHKVRGLRVIGVDEISYLKGKKYATVVYDLERSVVVWIGKGKAKKTLQEFLDNKLSEHQRNQIKAACCDMARGYVNALTEKLPNARLTIDKFHVVKALNEAVDEVRKQAWRNLDKDQRKSIKGLRWLLFYNSTNRSKADSRALNALRKSNNQIYRAWLLKDEFEHFWEYAYAGSAEKFLKKWCTRALKSRIEPIRQFVFTLRRYKDHILSFITTGVTNAVAEGINRILRMVKNRASGFRNLNAFADVIYLAVGDVDIPNSIPQRFRTMMI